MKVKFAQRGNHYSAADLQAVQQVLKAPRDYNKWSTIRGFEKQFAEYCSAHQALATSSCTTALHLCLKGIDLKKGDEVITTPWTWVATANVILLEHARPVFVDIRPDTYNLDEAQLESRITSRTRAILPVHFAGHPCEMDQIMALAKQYDLKVISDAAHAIGASYRGQTIGSFEDLAAFSFYTQKNMSTLGEGGMVTCNQPEMMEAMQLYQNHGVRYLNNSANAADLERPWYRDVVQVGNNYRMSEVQAAVGTTQLDQVAAFNATRCQFADQYSHLLKSIPGLTIPTVLEHVQSAWHFYVIRIGTAFGLNRDQLYRVLGERGIETSVHYTPLYYFKPYADLGYQKGDFPVAEQAYEEVLSLPLHPGLTDDQVSYVCETLKQIQVNHG